MITSLPPLGHISNARAIEIVDDESSFAYPAPALALSFSANPNDFYFIHDPTSLMTVEFDLLTTNIERTDARPAFLQPPKYASDVGSDRNIMLETVQESIALKVVPFLLDNGLLVTPWDESPYDANRTWVNAMGEVYKRGKKSYWNYTGDRKGPFTHHLLWDQAELMFRSETDATWFRSALGKGKASGRGGSLKDIKLKLRLHNVHPLVVVAILHCFCLDNGLRRIIDTYLERNDTMDTLLYNKIGANPEWFVKEWLQGSDRFNSVRIVFPDQWVANGPVRRVMTTFTTKQQRDQSSVHDAVQDFEEDGDVNEQYFDPTNNNNNNHFDQVGGGWKRRNDTERHQGTSFSCKLAWPEKTQLPIALARMVISLAMIPPQHEFNRGAVIGLARKFKTVTDFEAAVHVKPDGPFQIDMIWSKIVEAKELVATKLTAVANQEIVSEDNIPLELYALLTESFKAIMYFEIIWPRNCQRVAVGAIIGSDVPVNLRALHIPITPHLHPFNVPFGQEDRLFTTPLKVNCVTMPLLRTKILKPMAFVSKYAPPRLEKGVRPIDGLFRKVDKAEADAEIARQHEQMRVPLPQQQQQQLPQQLRESTQARAFPTAAPPAKRKKVGTIESYYSTIETQKKKPVTVQQQDVIPIA